MRLKNVELFLYSPFILIRKKKTIYLVALAMMLLAGDIFYFLRKVQWFPKFWGNNEKNALRVL